MNQGSLSQFPKERIPTIDEVRIGIIRETSLWKMQKIALGLLLQMEQSDILRCDFCARSTGRVGDQATL
jgi:hypothetical protein